VVIVGVVVVVESVVVGDVIIVVKGVVVIVVDARVETSFVLSVRNVNKSFQVKRSQMGAVFLTKNLKGIINKF